MLSQAQNRHVSFMCYPLVTPLPLSDDHYLDSREPQLALNMFFSSISVFPMGKRGVNRYCISTTGVHTSRQERRQVFWEERVHIVVVFRSLASEDIPSYTTPPCPSRSPGLFLVLSSSVFFLFHSSVGTGLRREREKLFSL